jgi:hypothetical protein
MANSVSASFAEIWAREMQVMDFVSNVWKPQANFRLEKELKSGDLIRRQYRGRPVAGAYTRGSDVTLTDLTHTSETLTVDTTPYIAFYISDLDELQSTPSSRQDHTRDSVEYMQNIINGHYTAEVANAGSTVDAADVGGTAGDGIDVDVSNIDKLFTIAMKRLGRNNVFNYKAGQSPFAANLTPDLYQILLERIAGRESILGDKLSENGHAGMYMGFDLFVHNAGYWTGRLDLSVLPTDGDTLVLKVADQTITVTFSATIGTAGDVHIASTVDITRANLVEHLNAPGTTEAEATDTGYTAFSNDHQSYLYGLTATNDNSNDRMTLTWRGVGAPIVSETFSSASNVWKDGLNISENLFTRKGAVDMVLQRYPKIQVDRDPDRIEENIIKIYSLFGLKTYADGARRMVNVKVDTTSYT